MKNTFFFMKPRVTFFLVIALLFGGVGTLLSTSSPAVQSPAPAGIFNEKNTLVTDARALTFQGPRSGEGYFSADGQKMIFQSEREPGNPFYQMFLMDLKTGDVTRLSPGKGKTTCGWIHPQMKKALWSSTHEDKDIDKKVSEELAERKKPVKGKYAWSFDEKFDIFESDLQGKNLKHLTRELGYDAEASYSPDGQWIAYASNAHAYKNPPQGEEKTLFEKDPSSQMEIYIMKADGSQKKRLTQSLGYDGGPFFSADGKKITWRRFSAQGTTAEIFTMNTDGSEQKQITHLNAMSWAPYFHPSGDYIVFASSVLGFSNFELFIVDSQGLKNPVRVTFDDGFDGLASFNPKKEEITWSHRNEKGESQILLARWDDHQARQLLGLSERGFLVQDFSPEIKSSDAMKIVRYLSSPQFEGRPTGGPKEKELALKYVDLLKSWGLVGGAPQGGFLQEFTFTSGVSLGAKNSLELVGPQAAKLSVTQDFIPASTSASGNFPEAPVVFAGYGLKVPATEQSPSYDSYKNLDVKGKWVLVLRDFPDSVSPEMKRQMLQVSRPQHKVTVAKNEGALGVLFVQGPGSGGTENFSQIKFEGTLSENSIPVLWMKSSRVESLMKNQSKTLAAFEKSGTGEQFIEGFEIPQLKIKAEVDLVLKKSTGYNVVARLKAPTSTMGILIGAHGDHLGHGDMGSSLAKGTEQGQIHGGADDNASGVAGVLELAHYFSQESKAKPKSLKKDLYFAIWSGEEIGILGSAQFTKDWNKFQKKSFEKFFEAGLNMDMIGRLREQLYVQGVGSGDRWISIAEKVARSTDLPLSLQEDPYLPTDSMALYVAGIPSISFFTGAHSDYHTPRDTADLINAEGMMKVLEVIKSFTQNLTAQNQRLLKYQKVESKAQGRGEGRSFRIYLGTIPDYSQEGVKGVRISGVSKDSPAEKAGLKDKDIIVEFAGTKIENIYDYVYTLQTATPKKETSIKVLRGDKTEEMKIIPSLKE